MQTYLALLRGVNVGGKNRVPMEQLKGILSDVGYSHVHTYINSGNILFSAADGLQPEPLQAQMQELIFTHFGVTTAAAVFQGRTIQKALSNAPSWWGSDPTRKHDAIFVIPPRSAKERLETVGVQHSFEQAAAYGPVIFWSAPIKTFSRTNWSKLAGTPDYSDITIRNANTARKLLRLLEERD